MIQFLAKIKNVLWPRWKRVQHGTVETRYTVTRRTVFKTVVVSHYDVTESYWIEQSADNRRRAWVHTFDDRTIQVDPETLVPLEEGSQWEP